jgi:hypothetical protein
MGISPFDHGDDDGQGFPPPSCCYTALQSHLTCVNWSQALLTVNIFVNVRAKQLEGIQG